MNFVSVVRSLTLIQLANDTARFVLTFNFKFFFALVFLLIIGPFLFVLSFLVLSFLVLSF